MDLSRLGPLEKSIIKALLRAETAGAPLSVPQIWRSLPSYSTHLSNVLGALAEGSALASFLSEARGQYVLRDQEHLLSEFGQQRQRADALWTELQGVVESLCREPVIHGLALAGSMAWGMPPAPGQPTELFVIAVPRKTLDAAAAVQLVGANLAHDQGLAASEVVAVDELVLAPGDLSRALELLSLRPILSESAFMTLWEHNGWLEEAFPNFDLVSRLGGDIPDVLLGEVLEDRRFILRRLLSRRVRRIGGAVRALGRRRGQRRGVGQSGHSATLQPPVASTAPVTVEQRQALLDRRWTALQDWLLSDPVVAATPEEAPPGLEAGADDNVGQGLDAEESASSEPSTRSTRRRRGVRRPARQHRAAASGEFGQRGRGEKRGRGRGLKHSA